MTMARFRWKEPSYRCRLSTSPSAATMNLPAKSLCIFHAPDFWLRHWDKPDEPKAPQEGRLVPSLLDALARSGKELRNLLRLLQQRLRIADFELAGLVHVQRLDNAVDHQHGIA